MSEKEKFFKPIKKTFLSELDCQDIDKIPHLCESDITIQTDKCLVQYRMIEEEDDGEKTKIKEGCYTLEESRIGLKLIKFQLKKYELLESIDNTKVILNEANKFFNKLEVYKELGKNPKRALLLASAPGTGKTAAINKVCETFLKDKGTAVVIWDTSQISSADVNKFFLTKSVFEDIEKFILVMEDIGGGSVDDYHGPRGADSSLLNLLDGVGDPFKGIPTFIIATTNNPENGAEALIDRPGRFDRVEILKTPNKKEAAKLLRFLGKERLVNVTDEEIDEIAQIASKNDFSIAHLQEIIVRSMLDDTSLKVATEQLVAHKKRFKDAFNDPKNKLGFNG